MRNLILFGLLIILLLAAQFASAKTVDEVIEKYIRARGGKHKLASVKSIYMEGVKEVDGELFNIKIIKEQDRLSRTEIVTARAAGFVLVTNNEAWTFFSGTSPDVYKIPEQDLPVYKKEIDIAGPLVDYISKGHKAELVGKETIEDNLCYKIKLTASDGKEMMFWIDANTYLVNQTAGNAIGINGTQNFTLYKNYKQVDGILFAHTTESKTNKMNTAPVGGEINFYKITLNQPVDATMYQPNNQS